MSGPSCLVFVKGAWGCKWFQAWLQLGAGPTGLSCRRLNDEQLWFLLLAPCLVLVFSQKLKRRSCPSLES